MSEALEQGQATRQEDTVQTQGKQGNSAQTSNLTADP